jgi:hypothetical protein
LQRPLRIIQQDSGDRRLVVRVDLAEPEWLGKLDFARRITQHTQIAIIQRDLPAAQIKVVDAQVSSFDGHFQLLLGLLQGGLGLLALGDVFGGEHRPLGQDRRGRMPN